MRKTIAAAVLLSSVLIAPACSKSRSFELPELGEAELAFGAVYDSTDRAVAVGPVVTRQRLKAGGYSVEAHGSDYRARLFLVRVSDLQLAAREGCGDLERRADQRACLDLIESCETDPIPCLAVFPTGDRCGERLQLPKTMKLEAFESDAADKLTPVEDSAALAESLELCGPVIAPPCPNALPGWSVTESGQFRCAAPATQLECSVEIDLSDCGFGKARGTLDPAGTLTGTIDTPPCAIAPIEASDEIPGKSEGAFAIACGRRRFVATPMELLFGEPECARRGPPIYNEATSALADIYASYGVGTGKITGLKPIRPGGWSARYLFAGTGHDDCALGGCGNINAMTNCSVACTSDCTEFITLPDCAGANLDAMCTGRDTKAGCQERCENHCNDKSMTCRDDVVGHALALVDPEKPEGDRAQRLPKVTDLDAIDGREDGAKGASALVLLGDRTSPSIAVASRRRVRVYKAQSPDTLAPLVNAQKTLNFDISGIAPLPGRTNELVAFGTAAGFGSIQILRLTEDVDPDLVDANPTGAMTSGLPSADAVAIGGPEDTWIFLAALDAPIGTLGASTIEIMTVDQAMPPPSIDVGGRPTAIGALPGGAIGVGTTLGDGSRDSLVILTPDGASNTVTRAATLAIAGDLELVYILEDLSSCATQDLCRIYLGYRQRGANSDHGNALVGILEFDRMNPAASRIIPTYVETAAEELSTLELDTLRNELIAVASTQNRLTPIRLW